MKQYAVIFDMDGTLLQTDQLAIPAFEQMWEGLQQEGYILGDVPTRETILHCLGKTLDEIWAALFGSGVDQNGIKERAEQHLTSAELEILQKGQVQLYPGTIRVLAKLHGAGYPIFVASNGQDSYVQAVCSTFQIHSYIQEIYTAGKFGTASKVELVRKLKNKYQFTQGLMVGDRHSDVEAGKLNGFQVAACAYGFSSSDELTGADYYLQSITEILEIIQS